MKDFINVGLLGAGTVGGGVIKVLEKMPRILKKRWASPFVLPRFWTAMWKSVVLNMASNIFSPIR